MATLNYQSAQPSGTTLTLAAASGGGDKVKAKDNGCVLVTNGGGSSVTVTIDTPGNDKYGNAIPQITKAVAAGASAVFGPFGKDLENPSDHLVAISYSGVTSVTVGAFTV